MSEPPIYYPPPSGEISSATLAGLFSDVTNSYKFLFFLALLDNLERHCFKASSVSLDELVIDMLTIAWYPYSYFRLSFGKQDKVTKELDERKAQVLVDAKISPLDRQTIRSSLAAHSATKDLKRFVPYRLIRPFFAKETAGLKDHIVNSKVAELAAEYFVARKPPYKFNAEETELQIHPDWLTYFKRNIVVLRGWVSWKWLQYMQRCNPNVPGLATKLFPPLERDSLAAQTKYWKLVLDNIDFRCIYSDNRIKNAELSLDHFVPWSFVVHDELWNLIPTTKQVNSKKGDRLPSEKYLEKFINAQHQALTVARDVIPKWKEETACFHRDLGIKQEADLFDLDALMNRYKGTIVPLMQLAEINGFEVAWEYRD